MPETSSPFYLHKKYSFLLPLEDFTYEFTIKGYPPLCGLGLSTFKSAKRYQFPSNLIQPAFCI